MYVFALWQLNTKVTAAKLSKIIGINTQTSSERINWHPRLQLLWIHFSHIVQNKHSQNTAIFRDV